MVALAAASPLKPRAVGRRRAALGRGARIFARRDRKQVCVCVCVCVWVWVCVCVWGGGVLKSARPDDQLVRRMRTYIDFYVYEAHADRRVRDGHREREGSSEGQREGATSEGQGEGDEREREGQSDRETEGLSLFHLPAARGTGGTCRV